MSETLSLDGITSPETPSHEQNTTNPLWSWKKLVQWGAQYEKSEENVVEKIQVQLNSGLLRVWGHTASRKLSFIDGNDRNILKLFCHGGEQNEFEQNPLVAREDNEIHKLDKDDLNLSFEVWFAFYAQEEDNIIWGDLMFEKASIFAIWPPILDRQERLDDTPSDLPPKKDISSPLMKRNLARKLARNLAWVTEAKRLKITHPSHSTSQIAKLIHDNEKLNFFGKKSETIRKVITPALSKA